MVGTPFDAGYFTALLRWTGTDPSPFDLATHLDDTLDLVPRGLLLP